MIELLLEDRCTGCDRCVQVCPTTVFDSTDGGTPTIARPEDCQTCFLCEVHCPADAVYVAPCCDARVPVDLAFAAEHAGQYRRDSGWGVWRRDPEHRNEVWRMDMVFEQAFAQWGIERRSGR
jgi:NAD-dependent dihydropyrimidine dehydrogenase PreA subunit